MFSSLNYPTYSTVEPRNYRPAFKGSPSIKVKILRSQMIFFKVISPLFTGGPEIKVKNLQSQWNQWGGVLLYLIHDIKKRFWYSYLKLVYQDLDMRDWASIVTSAVRPVAYKWMTCFHIFRIVRYGATNGQTNERKDGQTDNASYRNASQHFNKVGYTASPVACGWAGAVFEVTWSFGQEQWGQRPQKPLKK